MSSLRDETESDIGSERNVSGRSWWSGLRNSLQRRRSTRSAAPQADLDEMSKEVYQRLQRYSDEVGQENPQGLLFRIAANVANEIRERARVQQPGDRSWLAEIQTKAADELEGTNAAPILRDHVQAAVRTLPQRQRLVLMLHVNEGLTYKQIADRQGLPYGVVLRDLCDAYSKLSKHLSAPQC